MKKIVIASACRTAIGKFGGTLANVPAAELGSIVIKEALNRANVKPEQVDHVYMGCVIQAGLGQNVARQAALKAGLPIETPAVTVNVVCGSGLNCVNMAAQMIEAGDADIVVAGGMENMDMAPFAMMKGRYGYRMGAPMGKSEIVDTMVNDALWDACGFNKHMGMTAENVCTNETYQKKYGYSPITREMLDDLTTRDQRMLFAVVTLVHLADSKEELDSDTETLQSIARKHLCQLAKLSFQQQDGLVTALPLGLRRIDALRTLTTEALAVLMPFKAQEIRHRHGIYYGQNAISKNLILADRKELLNGNGFILGVSGSGKSFAAKREITEIALSTNDDIIIIDPEAEYRPLVEGLGGEVIEISATSPNHINALDMESGYNDGDNPVVLKSEFLLSLCEQLVGAGKLSAKEKSIIDRCTAQVYREFIRNGYLGVVPTLQDFHAALLEQPEPEARDVALALELFTEGSLNTFAKYTNVDTNSRILCYDIRDLGKQLLPVGMLVVLDSVFNRIIRNRKLGKNTWLYIDEIYLLFQHEYSANFLFTLWKRMRKYGACGTGLTQNVDDLLQSHTARTMLANSEFLLMLNQASTDRIELARLLNISDNQLSYISGVDFGHGLLKCGSTIVPFVDHFPKNGRLYQLMTTKMSERVEQAS